jgi:early secretory antigenic target protein ESAT-6
MSNGQYRVSWALQAEAAASVNSAIATMDSELSAINSQVNALVGSWDSDAQQAYLARQQQWNTASDNIKAALQQFMQGLNSSADIASGTESTNVGVVS